MKHRLWLLILILLLPLTALAATHDPLPTSPELPSYADPIGDCIVLDMPDGGQAVFILTEYGAFDGYLLENGQWLAVLSSNAMDYRAGLEFVRHSPAVLRADGSAYADALGFDIVHPESGAYLSYHYDGERFTLCGWADPERYAGEVLTRGTALEYYAPGSLTPALVADAQDEQTLYSWCSDWRNFPATPKEGQAYAALLPDRLAARFPGYTFCGCQGSVGETEANYVQIENGLLRIKRVTFAPGGEIVSESTTFAVPLSDTALALAQTEPLDSLINARRGDSTFRKEDLLDPALLAPGDTLLQSDLQADALLLLVRDSAGDKRLRIVTPASGGGYRTESTQPLPQDAYMDIFHTGENAVQLEWDAQYIQVGFQRGADDIWRLSWIQTNRGVYSLCAFGLNIEETLSLGTLDDYRIGTLPNTDLTQINLSELPVAPEELLAALERANWAVVCNPDPSDRLNLRAAPDRAAESLGKFYNGTPVRLLEKQGKWYRVRIGTSGPEGWMMAPYLVSGEAMDQVACAFPQQTLLDAYAHHPLYANREMKIETESRYGVSAWLVGVTNDEQLYIILYEDGCVRYAPRVWFWEGNG